LQKSRGNSQESFLGIRGNSQESFTGKSGQNVDSFSQEFIVTHSQEPMSEEFLVTHSEEFLVTHSEEMLVTLSKEFLVTNSREFLVTNSSEKPETICSKKVFQNQFLGISLELFPRFSQEFLRNILKYSLTKVVNNITTILPLQLFRSITIFLCQNVIAVFDLTEVVMYFFLFRQMNCEEKIKKNVLKFLNIYLKDGSEVNYHFLSIRMRKKKI